jgi:hypothetical protein
VKDTEIKSFIQNILVSAGDEFSLCYKRPIAPGSSHSLELESKTCLGTLSVWASGLMDWHIFDIATSTEVILGCGEAKDITGVRETFLEILEKVRARDIESS